MKNTRINISSFTLEFLLPDHAEDSFRGNDRDYKKAGKQLVKKINSPRGLERVKAEASISIIGMCFNLVRMITILGVPGLVKELKTCQGYLKI